MIMRGLQRFVVRLPFSIRCDSESSVALAVSSNTARCLKQSNTEEKGGKDNNSKMNKTQSLSKASFSQGLHSFMRRVKSFSQLFVYKEKMEDMEKEIEIGFPTDVKHVTHIGSDGSTTTINQVPNWEMLSFPSISLQQFELAMAAQSHAPPSTN